MTFSLYACPLPRLTTKEKLTRALLSAVPLDRWGDLAVQRALVFKVQICSMVQAVLAQIHPRYIRAAARRKGFLNKFSYWDADNPWNPTSMRGIAWEEGAVLGLECLAEATDWASAEEEANLEHNAGLSAYDPPYAFYCPYVQEQEFFIPERYWTLFGLTKDTRVQALYK